MVLKFSNSTGFVMGTHKGEAVSILDCFLAVFELIIPVKIIS
jgi:hypothetical protein